MIIFLDTEFDHLPDPMAGYLPAPKLISIGLISEDAQYSLYAESNDWHYDRCSEFVRREVLPVLMRLPGSSLSKDNLKTEILNFLSGLPAQEKHQIACDSHLDWSLMLTALRGSLPPNIEPACLDISEYLTDPIFAAAKARYFSESHPRHHALHDATANWLGWLAFKSRPTGDVLIFGGEAGAGREYLQTVIAPWTRQNPTLYVSLGKSPDEVFAGLELHGGRRDLVTVLTPGTDLKTVAKEIFKARRRGNMGAIVIDSIDLIETGDASLNIRMQKAAAHLSGLSETLRAQLKIILELPAPSAGREPALEDFYGVDHYADTILALWREDGELRSKRVYTANWRTA